MRSDSGQTADPIKALFERNGREFYTFCLKLCLDSTTDADILFRDTLLTAHHTRSNLPTDERLAQACHQAWKQLAPGVPHLAGTSTKLSFDWSTPTNALAESALLAVTPEQREILLLRLLLKFPLTKISRITGLDNKRVATIFSDALERIVSP